MANKHQLIILGAGPAGLTAAIYASRANLHPVVITGIEQGGQITKTHILDNWPGDVMGVEGFALANRLLEHAQRFEAQIINDQITTVNFKQRPFYLRGENAEYTCDKLIIATGASPRLLNLPRETELVGKGVSYCAVCDGFFYKNKKVAVIGGSDTAAIDSLYLANLASEVIIIYRRDHLRAEPIVVDKLKQLKNVKVEFHSIVTEILGNQELTGIKLQNTQTNQTKELKIDGLFIAIGHQPNTVPFIDQLVMENGYIKVKGGTTNATATSVDGIFAAGDVVNYNYQQAIVAAAHGAMAAMDVRKAMNN